MRSPPDLIRLDTAAQGSCTCGARCTISGEKITRPCTVYTLTRSYESHIELQICARCSSRHRQFIGGDLRELGLFNFNNRILMTHDLLDDYTASYTSSETPFVAWVGVVSRRYQRHASPKKFIPDSVFRAAWFAYSRLQWLVGDMECPTCGPTPEDTIWDGVTLSFSKKHLLPSLRPLQLWITNLHAMTRNTFKTKRC
ncbi:hypothetical protein BD779DRAFT_1614536 [Infundibulicybe gibba]|nr:hypothetical protein BD779DRAFT_1614536 [Infundibulicybe gibba]